MSRGYPCFFVSREAAQSLHSFKWYLLPSSLSVPFLWWLLTKLQGLGWGMARWVKGAHPCFCFPRELPKVSTAFKEHFSLSHLSVLFHSWQLMWRCRAFPAEHLAPQKPRSRVPPLPTWLSLPPSLNQPGMSQKLVIFFEGNCCLKAMETLYSSQNIQFPGNPEAGIQAHPEPVILK